MLRTIDEVYQLFLESNPKDPLNHNVGKLMRDGIDQFNANLRLILKGGYYFNHHFPDLT